MKNIQIWKGATFAGVDGGGEIGAGDPVVNSGFNAAELVVFYKSFDPDGESTPADFFLQAMLEGEVAPGVWAPVAVQLPLVKGSDQALQQVISLRPGPTDGSGVAEKVFVGTREAMAVSRFDGTAPDKLRARLHQGVPGNGGEPLKSVTVDCYLKLFNRV